MRTAITYLSFLSVYSITYGLMHLYFFKKVRNAFNFPIIGAWLISLVMVLAPILFRLSEDRGNILLAKIFAHTGYTWMGFIFLFCCAALLTDLCRLFFHISPQVSFVVPCLIALCISAYGYFEADNIRVRQIEMKTEKLPGRVEGIKIVQISDLHLGMMGGEKRLRKVVDLVKKINPDIIVSTGDLVDSTSGKLEGYSNLLRELSPRYGKYAVTGNHECYAGMDHSIKFTEQSGFKVLRNEYNVVGDLIVLSGVDYPEGRIARSGSKDIKQELLMSLPKDKFVIHLEHKPDIRKENIGLFDLQLSGHTHRGQIFPMHFIVRLFYPRFYGFYNLGNKSYLYASAGAGSWGPQCRFLAPPEITLMRISSK